MSKLYKPNEIANAIINEQKRRQDALREQSIQEAKDNMYTLDEDFAKIMNEAYTAKANTEKMKNFKSQVKKSLLSEAINVLYTAGLGSNRVKIANEDAIKRTVIDKFIDEQGGATNLLESFAGKSYVLSEMYNVITEAYNNIIEASDESKSLNVTTDDTKEFFNKLLDIDGIDDIGTSIKMRVSAAIEDFNISNMENKSEIENIISITKDNIANAKTEQLKEHYNIAGEQKINAVKQAKPKNIFECMMINNTKNVYTDKSLKERYVNESGNIDYDAIEESTELLYTFLETVNTAKLADIDENYIREMIK